MAKILSLRFAIIPTPSNWTKKCYTLYRQMYFFDLVLIFNIYFLFFTNNCIYIYAAENSFIRNLLITNNTNSLNEITIDGNSLNEIEKYLTSLEKIIYEIALEKKELTSNKSEAIYEFLREILSLLENSAQKLEEIKKLIQHNSKFYVNKDNQDFINILIQLESINSRIKNLCKIIDHKLNKKYR